MVNYIPECSTEGTPVGWRPRKYKLFCVNEKVPFASAGTKRVNGAVQGARTARLHF